MNASISVALCTFNGSRFIEQQLESVLAQSRPPQEIVISDDNSSDNTVAVIRKYLAAHATSSGHRDLRVRVIENHKSLGVTANFQQAVAACTGDLIALCDQDDVWHADKLKRLSAVFARRPKLLLLHTDARLVDEIGVPLGGTLIGALEMSVSDRDAIHRGDAFEPYLRRNFATGATTVLRRTLLARALPFPEEWIHDEWLAIVAASLDGLDFLPELLIDYRQHSSNQIGVKGPTLVNKIRRVLEPRGQRNESLALRSTVLLARLSNAISGVDASKLERLRGKSLFELTREDLPACRLRRIVPVIREASRGHYAEYASQGRKDIFRDLIQPH